MRVVLALAVAVLARAASPTTGLESLRHLQNKFALTQTTDLTQIVSTLPTGGSTTTITDALKTVEAWKKWNATCLPILQEYQNNADCKKMLTYTGVATVGTLKEICENTCRTAMQSIKQRLSDAGCTKAVTKTTSTTTFDDDDDKKALKGLEMMCQKQGDEYCLITMDRVSAINIDTVNWENDAEADAALAAYCSPCMEKMAPMLKKNGGDQDGIKLKLQMRYIMCNKDDKGNFCWKKVARLAKLSARSQVQQDACATVSCQEGYRCRIPRNCDKLPCTGTCVARIDPASTILGSDPVKTLIDVSSTIESIPRPTGKATIQQTTVVTSSDLQEDVSLAAAILSKREQIAEICENNCFQRSLVQLAKLFKQDGREKAYGRINGIVDKICQRNEEKVLCLTKFVNDIPTNCTPSAIAQSQTCSDECKQAITDRLNAAKCCAPIITKVWAAASNLAPEQVRNAWRSTCKIQFDESDCPAKNETLTRKLHLALDYAWYSNLPENRKKAFRDSVVDDVARHVYPLAVSLDDKAISAGSIVVEPKIEGESASTVVAASLDSSSSGIMLDSTSAQVSQDLPFTSATVIAPAAPASAPSPSGSGAIIAIVVAIVGVVAIAAIIGVVVMKKRRQSAPANVELTETLSS